MANTGVTTFSLLCVVHLYCVLGTQNTEFIFTPEISSKRQQNVIVNLGSTVTFSCLNKLDVRTNWYRLPSSRKAVALADKDDNDCVLHNENYPSISLEPCSDENSGITFNRIQYTDSGAWWCVIYVNNTLISSQYVYVDVKENIAWSTPFQVFKSKTTAQVLTRPTTLVNTKWPGTTDVITGPPGNGRNTTRDGVNSSKSSGYLINVVTGASGLAVLLAVIFTILILKRRRRNYSQNVDQGNRNPEDTNQAQVSVPGGDYSNLHSDPQIDSHVYTDITERARGQVVRKEGNYSTLHTDSHEYTHMYGVIDGRTQERFQAQMTPQQADYYNCGPQKKKDVHL